jgi:endonuclease/exonuclease/phosphatase family metal-dependent hydrolase
MSKNPRRLTAVLAGCALAMAAGCASTGTAPEPTHDPLEATGLRVMVDGLLDEWPEGVAALADAHYLYLTFTLPGDEFTLQSFGETVELWLDIDNDRSTGVADASVPETALMGTDIRVEFSPHANGGVGYGTRVRALDSQGRSTELSHADIDLIFAPTFASDSFELRVSRHLDHIGAVPQPGLASNGDAAAAFVLSDSTGRVIGASDPVVIDLPRAADGPRLADTPMPVRPEGAIRVLSYNVLKASPRKDADRFARIIQAVSPDVILLQEWDDATRAELEGWFTALIPSEGVWRAHVPTGGSVAIASTHPIRTLAPEFISVVGRAQPIRFVGAVVETPLGDAAVASVHLKCCGSKDSPEDLTRMEEAEAINDALRAALGDSGPAIRLIGGDFNLVGSRPPLDLIREGLDADGSDLSVADPHVVGDASVYTWSDANSPFTPGRLDYMVYSDAGARLAQAFVLDTSRLSDRALARLGLDRTDTSASDHLPVVIDLLPGR